MRRIILLAGLVLALGVLLPASARSGAVLAAPPSNDTLAGATPVAGVPFSQELDTTAATTDADDTQLWESCGGADNGPPATDASVWYAFTGGTGARVVIDVSQSSYPAGVMVGVVSHGNLEGLACSWNGLFETGQANFTADAGTSYYVLAYDSQEDLGGNGGTLRISFNPPPPPPTVDLTVDPSGTVDTQTGVARISGTYTCTNADFGMSVFGNARQNFGRFSTSGFFGFDGPEGACDGAPHTFAADLVPQNGKFKGGKMTTMASAHAMGPFDEAFASVEQTVQLRGGKSLALPTGAVLAAAPSNDTFAGATPVAVGFSEELDTTGATTDANDFQLATQCEVPPVTDASVWYAFTGADAGVVVDVSQSSYSAGVMYGVGSEGNLFAYSCGGPSVSFFAEAGITYYVLAYDSQEDGGGNGGTLRISFNPPPPPPTVDLTVNRRGEFNAHTGAATISGTYTCTDADFISVGGDARQNVGKYSVSGFFDFFEGTCDGAPHTWTADAVPENGRFAGGKLVTAAQGFACGQIECSGVGPVEQMVQLSRK